MAKEKEYSWEDNNDNDNDGDGDCLQKGPVKTVKIHLKIKNYINKTYIWKSNLKLPIKNLK